MNSWRWPRLRREFLRRRFLKAMTFGPRPCSITSAATLAPEMVGVPSCGLSPPSMMHVADLHDLARLAFDALDLEDLVFGDPVLLAAGFDDCEHRSCPVFDTRRSGLPGRLLSVDL